jgi:hypothetical protein
MVQNTEPWLTQENFLLAFNSIIGVAVILQQLTFAVPVFFLVIHKRSDSVLPPARTFSLPNWLGWICNIVTLSFTCVTTSILFLPAGVAPTGSTMSKFSEYPTTLLTRNFNQFIDKQTMRAWLQVQLSYSVS